MSLFDDQYFRINFYMFCIYNDFKFVGAITRVVWTSFAGTLLIAAVATQLSVFIVRGFTMRNIINVLPGFTATIMSICYLIIFHFNKKKHEILTLKTIAFYNEKDSEDVLMIKEASMSMMKRILMFTTIGFALGTCAVNLMAFIPRILDSIAPLNHSRPIQLPFEAEYYVDVQEYFYVIIVLQITASCVVVTVVGVFLNTVIVCLLKLCTFFKIIGHRLTTLDTAIKDCEKHEGHHEEILVSKVMICLKDHQRAIDYATMLNECGDSVIFCGVVTIIITLTFTFAQITDTESVDLKSVLLLIAQLVEFAAGCFLGQEVINSSVSLSEKAYNCNWYDYPIAVQKLLMILLMRSQRPCCLSSKGIFIVCNKSFATILQTTTSYCMVLSQLQ